MHELATTSPDLASLKQVPDSSRGCWFWAGWEPDRYYQRIGARKTPYFGNGDWVKDWRRNLESAESLRMLSAAGATVLVTRFYKGFGPELEGTDWASLKAFVQRAHEKGIAVWGYLQGQSIFGEFLFNERPEASDWVAQNDKGQPLLWAGVYNRYAPCLTSAAYREMMEDLIDEGLCSVGLDGIHMDNNYYRHCYCPRCKELFRDWLSRRGDLEARTGIQVADFVEPPPLLADVAMVPDPLAILWIEFGVHTRAEFMRAMRAKVHQCKAGATFSGNPAFLRTYASRLTHGLDPTEEHGLLDSVCVENGNLPRFENGKLYTQADKHLFAEAAGLRSWVTSWCPGPYDSSPPMSRTQLWAGLAEEFSFRHACLGNNWALRPAGDGGKLLLDPMAGQWREFIEATAFFQALERRLGDVPRRQWGEVAFYVDTRSLSIFPGSDARIVQAFLIGALGKHLPCRIILRGQDVPLECHTILVVQQRALEEAEFSRLAQAAGQGHHELWLIGECGTYDEWCVPRSNQELERWRESASVRVMPLEASQWLDAKADSSKYLKGETPALREQGQAELSNILADLAGRQVLRIESSPGVMSNIEKFEEGGWFIHLRCLDSDREVTQVRVHLRSGQPDDVRLLAYTPEWPEGKALEFTKQDAVIQVSLPDFSPYMGLRVYVA